MSKIGPGYWDGVANGANSYENFHDLLSILDFPLESLEEDGFAEDWDTGNFQGFGPIPTDALTGLHPTPQPYTGNGSLGAAIKSEASQNQLLNYGDKTSGAALLSPKKYPEDHKPVMFQTESPICVSENKALFSGFKILPMLCNFIVPVRTRSKRTRPSNVNPWLLISTDLASRNTSSAKKRATWGRQSGALKKCTHCEVTKTPQWREGPLGPRTLCNACGVRFRSGRLFPEYRPAASPTFVASQHSNSHKAVTEMRKKAAQEASMVNDGSNGSYEFGDI